MRARKLRSVELELELRQHVLVAVPHRPLLLQSNLQLTARAAWAVRAAGRQSGSEHLAAAAPKARTAARRALSKRQEEVRATPAQCRLRNAALA